MRPLALDVAPSPAVPGISIPWWAPFALGAGAVVLVPAVVAWRSSQPRRIAIEQWSSLLPIAGLALMSWAVLDTFALQLSWEEGCLPPVGPPCYRANRVLLVLGVAWAILAFGMFALLLRTIRTRASSRPTSDFAPWVTLLAAVSTAVGLGTLPYLGYTAYEPIASSIAWSAFTAAFVAFAVATIWAHRLVGRWAVLARGVTLAQGVVLMTFAFVSAYEAAGPPPVFA